MSLMDKGYFDADIAEVTRHLTGLERAMVIGSGAGTTHERIGQIESVTPEGDWIAFTGATHASRFDASQIARVAFDRTGGMGDRVIPRVEFRDASDKVVFQVSVLSGLENFDAALSALWPMAQAHEAAPEAKEAPTERPEPMTEEALREDLSWKLLEASVEAGRKVRISYKKAGFLQHWEGVISALRPAMGFINVMTSDFHLHLKGGSVTEWREASGVWQAVDAEGALTGLELAELAA